jgi:hypothetical protein
MRVIILLGVVGLMACTGCKKSIRTDSALNGRWRLVKIYSMLGVMTADDWGHTKKFTFEGDSKCVYDYDNNPVQTSYKLTGEDSYFEEGIGNFVSIANVGKYEYRFSHDSLMLSGDIRVDAPMEWYVRD